MFVASSEALLRDGLGAFHTLYTGKEAKPKNQYAASVGRYKV